jgi:predicted DNA-binding transcriptional regulator YafY
MLMREIGATSIQAVESASAKIERVLTEELRAITNALQYAVKLEDILPGTRAVTNGLIVMLSRAVYERSSLEIVYASGEGETSSRTIDPYGLVLHAHAWYVPAYCHLRRDLRIFRVDRIRVATPTGHTFTVPEAFDARAAVLDSLARVFGSVPFEVLLHVPFEIAREYISPGLAILTPAGEDTLMQVYAEEPSWFARHLAAINIPFTVVSNDALRDAVKSLANELLRSIKPPVPLS